MNVALGISVPAIGLFAANCNSNGNGNWNSSGTWTCNSAPNSGDEVVIAANATVTISNNLNYTGSPIHVKVYGTWYFSGGGAKISMACGSTVEIGFGGKVMGNGPGNSQTVRICNTTYWSASHGTVSGPRSWPPSTLPVELVSFSGSAQGKDIRLEWTTATETNSASFSIFRSRDAQHWELISSVAASGNSNTLTHYVVQDKVPTASSWYYRLRQQDLDGSLHEKGIIPIRVEEDQDIICGPIPVVEEQVQVWGLSGQPVLFELTSMGARASAPLQWTGHDGTYKVALGARPSGVHILTMVDEQGMRRSCRLLVL